MSQNVGELVRYETGVHISPENKNCKSCKPLRFRPASSQPPFQSSSEFLRTPFRNIAPPAPSRIFLASFLYISRLLGYPDIPKDCELGRGAWRPASTHVQQAIPYKKMLCVSDLSTPMFDW
jgi:hypothetical protein